jgi:hypothetical protein
VKVILSFDCNIASSMFAVPNSRHSAALHVFDLLRELWRIAYVPDSMFLLRLVVAGLRILEFPYSTCTLGATALFWVLDYVTSP